MLQAELSFLFAGGFEVTIRGNQFLRCGLDRFERRRAAGGSGERSPDAQMLQLGRRAAQVRNERFSLRLGRIVSHLRFLEFQKSESLLCS